MLITSFFKKHYSIMEKVSSFANNPKVKISIYSTVLLTLGYLYGHNKVKQIPNQVIPSPVISGTSSALYLTITIASIIFGIYSQRSLYCKNTKVEQLGNNNPQNQVQIQEISSEIRQIRKKNRDLSSEITQLQEKNQHLDSIAKQLKIRNYNLNLMIKQLQNQEHRIDYQRSNSSNPSLQEEKEERQLSQTLQTSSGLKNLHSKIPLQKTNPCDIPINYLNENTI